MKLIRYNVRPIFLKSVNTLVSILIANLSQNDVDLSLFFW